MSKRKEILVHVKAHPQAKPGEVAKAVGCSRQTVWAVLKRPPAQRRSTGSLCKAVLIANVPVEVATTVKEAAKLARESVSLWVRGAIELRLGQEKGREGTL